MAEQRPGQYAEFEHALMSQRVSDNLAARPSRTDGQKPNMIVWSEDRF